MADPYAGDSDEEVEDLLGPKEDANHILNAFQHVGKTIREGGFCSPRKDSSKDVQPTMNDTVVDSSDDSSHERAKRSVTFDDNIKEQLIENDLTMQEDEEDENAKEIPEPIGSSVKEEIKADKKKAMPITIFIIVAFLASLLFSFLFPKSFQSFSSVLKEVDDSALMKTILLLIAVLSANEMFLPNSEIGGIVKILWGGFVLSVVIAGMYYFTYDLEWLKD